MSRCEPVFPRPATHLCLCLTVSSRQHRSPAGDPQARLWLSDLDHPRRIRQFDQQAVRDQVSRGADDGGECEQDATSAVARIGASFAGRRTGSVGGFVDCLEAGDGARGTTDQGSVRFDEYGTPEAPAQPEQGLYESRYELRRNPDPSSLAVPHRYRPSLVLLLLLELENGVHRSSLSTLARLRLERASGSTVPAGCEALPLQGE